MTEERKAELQKVLRDMKGAAVVFYELAQTVGFHEFLEFNGFLTEYIKICDSALSNGEDFVDKPPTVELYQASYIGEKLNCIFGRMMRKPELIRAFNLKAFGVAVSVRQLPKPKRRRETGVVSSKELEGHPFKSLLARDYLPREGQHEVGREGSTEE